MDNLSFEFKAGIAGFFGAVISLRFLRDLSFMQMMLAVCGGFVSAYYLTHLFVAWFELPMANFGGVAFLIGLFGQSFAGAVIMAIRDADLLVLVKGWFKGPKS